jgi:hypothetical protein
MGELGALFNPGMRHELEERRARAARREEEGNARDGDLRIDLESGVAIINSPGDEDESDPAGPSSAQSDPSDSAGSDSGAPDSGAPGPGATEPGGTDSTGSATEAEPPEEANPASLRPRGKRAMTATRR